MNQQDIGSKAEPIVQDAVRQWQVPGLSVAIATNGQLWTAGFGMADVENAVPATADTIYRIASISKPITTTAILQLFEQGKLDLDAPVQAYVPTFPEKSGQITARLLLSHLSGIRDVAEGEMQSVAYYPPKQFPITTFLEAFQEEPLQYEPGTKFLYTTHGYNLLGAMIEAVSGMDYLSYVQEHIFQPSGMTHTFADDSRAIIPNRARGYTRANGELRNAPFTDTSNHLAGGGFCATAADIARFGVAWQSGRLLKPGTLQIALERQRTKTEQDTRFCLGWFTWTRNGETEVAHGGKHFGTSTMLTARMNSGTVVGVLTNLQDVSAPYLQSLTQKLADRVDKRGE